MAIEGLGPHTVEDTQHNAEDEIVFNHFNDVYHINDQKLLARFSHALRTADGITVFSGDALGPSLESSVLKGEHIIPVLNRLSIDVACYGNHDFDFGEDRLRDLSGRCNFPWVLSNAFSTDGELLALAKNYVVVTHKGYRLGFFGLAGSDWPSNCQNLPEGCTIVDPVQIAKATSRVLREREQVDFVVAITHMRLEEDILVSQACVSEVDLLLGGHDHDIVVQGDKLAVVNDTAEGGIRIVKSGTDFRTFSRVQLLVSRDDGKARIRKVKVHHTRDLSSAKRHPEDAGMTAILSSVHERVASVSGHPLLRTGSPLEGRTSYIRNSETNLGNLLADAVRAYYNTEIAFVNSGSVRCDRVVMEGELTVRDIIDIVPFDNPFVVKKMSGRVILKALENSVSDARTDGRFLQLSGLSILVDLRRHEGARILRATLSSGIPLSMDIMYTVTMVSFIAEGFDGYSLFKDTETLVGVEGAMTDTSLMLRIFRGPETGSDTTDEMIDRARNALIVGEEDGLPLVRPGMEKRITFAGAL